MKKTKGNQGFTLVELIVSLSITITIIALTCTVLVSAFGVFNNDTSIATAKIVGDNVSLWFKDNLRYSTKLEVTDEAKPTGTVEEYNTGAQIIDGNLMYWNTAKPEKKRNYFTGEYYNGMQVKMTSAVTNKRYLTYTVYVYDIHDKEVYHKKTTIEMVNLTLAEKNIDKADEATKADVTNYEITGKLATDKNSTNAIFYFSGDITVDRDDYNTVIPTMLSNIKNMEDIISDPVKRKEVFGVTWIPTNDMRRDYLLKNDYKGTWPLLSEVIDISKYSYPTGNITKALDKLPPLNVVFHTDVKTNNTIIYANNEQSGGKWAVSLMFVPNNSTDSNGVWYTYLPTTKCHGTVDNPDKWEKIYENIPSLTRTPRYGVGVTYKCGKDTVKVETLEDYYNMIRKYWNPLQ